MNQGEVCDDVDPKFIRLNKYACSSFMIKKPFAWPNIDRVIAALRPISVQNREGIHFCTAYN